MLGKISNRRICGLALLVALLLCTACSVGSVGTGKSPVTVAIVPHAVQAAARAGPFLYVAGQELSMYALGSSVPLHSTKGNYYEFQPSIALDSHGVLCEANGNPSTELILAFNARTLAFEGALEGDGVGPLAINRYGYLYNGSDAFTLVFAPGCTQYVGRIHNCQCGPLTFDRSGNLYGSEGGAVRIYAPTDKTWHLKFVRAIYDGINGPVALAIGPSGQLFVANSGYPSGSSSVRIFPAGGSKPAQRIKDGIDSPQALAVDSKGQLYVANRPCGPRKCLKGWVSVYAPGHARPLSKITAGINQPVSLAIDPAGNLYVANYAGTVTVYNAEGTKLLRTIKSGVSLPQAILIGSP